MRFLLGIMLFFTLTVPPEQEVIMHFSSNCIHVTENTWAEAAMKDGEIDWNNVITHRLNIDKNCGMIVVRRKKLKTE